MSDINETQQLENTTGYVYSKETFGTVDGPGIRYILFLQGCPLRCLYCHNPDSIPQAGGRKTTAKEAVADILQYKDFFKNGGVTFSGGEPLLQADFLIATMKLLKKEGMHIAIDTSGIFKVNDPKIKEAVDLADLILLDVKSIDEDVSKELCGASSENAFKMLDYCESTGKTVWVRQVLLKGYTLVPDSLQKLAQRLKPYTCIQRIELLPFHKLGEPKWENIGMEYKLGDTPATQRSEVEEVIEIFKKAGLQNVI